MPASLVVPALFLARHSAKPDPRSKDVRAPKAKAASGLRSEVSWRPSCRPDGSVGPERTDVHLALEYEPEELCREHGDRLGIVERKAKGTWVGSRSS